MRLNISGEYTSDWGKLAERLKAEVGYRCIRCRHRYQRGDDPRQCDAECTHLPDGKARVLTIHHLNGDKGDNRWFNTLALCQSCHLTIQARVIPERPWLWSHSPWFVPYVCGFYARYYGNLDITRQEAEADPDRWLALGQPWRTEFQEVGP